MVFLRYFVNGFFFDFFTFYIPNLSYFTPKRNFFYINTTYYYNIFLRKIQVKQAFLNKIINNG